MSQYLNGGYWPAHPHDETCTPQNCHVAKEYEIKPENQIEWELVVQALYDAGDRAFMNPQHGDKLYKQARLIAEWRAV